MTVNLELKKAYIRNLLHDKSVTSLDGQLLLKYLLNDDEALDKTKFVSSWYFHNKIWTRRLNVRAICLYEEPLNNEILSECVIYGYEKTNDTDHFLCDVKQFPKNETIIAVRYKMNNRGLDLVYRNVIEDSLEDVNIPTAPMICETTVYTRDDNVIPAIHQEKYSRIASSILDWTVYTYELNKLEEEIDEALDNKDFKLLKDLSKRLTRLKNNKPYKDFEIV